MACCDYECRNCGWVEYSNFEPDKCPKCGGQLWSVIGWDEAKCQDKDEPADEDLCLDMEYPEDEEEEEELGNNGEPLGPSGFISDDEVE